MCAAFLWKSSTTNAFSTSLNGTINDAVQTVALTSVTGLVAPGVLVIDRQDGVGNSTPTKREYISFTGINGSDLTGVTRGVAGSTAQSHNSGALVEAILSVTHWTDLVDFLQAEHDSAGKHIIGTATVNYTETKNLAVTSIASIANAYISTLTSTKISTTTLLYPRPTQIYWSWLGSLPTLLTGTATQSFPMVRSTRNWTLKNTFISVLSAPSLGALKIDINYYSTPTAPGTSIYSVLPLIGVGEYESLATPGTFLLTSLASGVYLRPEVEQPNQAGELMVSSIAEERT